MRKRIQIKVHTLFTMLHSSSAALFILSEIFFGATVSAISFILFIRLARVLADLRIAEFDLGLSYLVYSIRSPFLTSLMRFFSFLGNDFIILASIVIILLLISKKHKHEAYLFTLMVGIGVIINLLMKFIIARPRPFFEPLSIEAFSSFPSGHSMNSFVFYISLAFFVFRFTRNKLLSIVISFLSIVLIILIGFSRVYLGVHYPTDVFAGFIGGFWWFVTALLIEKTITLLDIIHAKSMDDHTRESVVDLEKMKLKKSSA